MYNNTLHYKCIYNNMPPYKFIYNNTLPYEYITVIRYPTSVFTIICYSTSVFTIICYTINVYTILSIRPQQQLDAFSLSFSIFYCLLHKNLTVPQFSNLRTTNCYLVHYFDTDVQLYTVQEIFPSSVCFFIFRRCLHPSYSNLHRALLNLSAPLIF